MLQNIFVRPVILSRSVSSLSAGCQWDGGSSIALTIQRAVSFILSKSKRRRPAMVYGACNTNPAPYGPSCDYACERALL